jgi:thiamine-monophosphate kinase
MTEVEMIQRLIARFPRSGEQLNGPFEADAEIVRLGDQVWALTMDEFSPAEDLFTDTNPAELGANLAVATLSDLLAAGAVPRFYLQAVTVPRLADPAFLDDLGKGIASVLAEAGGFLCGGDIGMGDTWRYCGFAMGQIASGRPLTRIMPPRQQTLWTSGELGDANLAAWRKTATPVFELRLKTAALVARHGGSCIDTSGGLLDALWCLHQVNPGMEINLQADQVPLAAGLREFAQASGLPAEAGLVGGAGEYELLFTTDTGLPPEIQRELLAAGATVIGTATPAPQGKLKIHKHGRHLSTMTTPPPCPREAKSLDEYIHQVLATASHLFTQPSP